ncbi:MAG: UPF0149 family protein [Pseudomonadota bacterium]
MNTAADYAELIQAADELECNVSVAESHGVLVGLACGEAAPGFERWFDELFVVPEDDDALGQRLKGSLRALYDRTLSSLAGDELDFSPLLPDDSSSLIERADALADWCRGYAYALSLSALQPDRVLSEEARELLNDVGAIAAAGHGADDDDAEAEDALIELEEYVRVGVMLVFEEMQPVLAASRNSVH